MMAGLAGSGVGDEAGGVEEAGGAGGQGKQVFVQQSVVWQGSHQVS